MNKKPFPLTWLVLALKEENLDVEQIKPGLPRRREGPHSKGGQDRRLNPQKSKTELWISYFLTRFTKTDACWIWKGSSRNKSSLYGSIRKGNLTYAAHRVSFAIFHRKSPDGLHVCHKCDNPRCVNPDHLFMGTDKDNMQDASLKGRLITGNNHPRAKIDESKALEIFRMWTPRKNGTKSLSKKLGISRQIIGSIINGYRWRRVTGMAPKKERHFMLPGDPSQILST